MRKDFCQGQVEMIKIERNTIIVSLIRYECINHYSLVFQQGENLWIQSKTENPHHQHLDLISALFVT